MKLVPFSYQGSKLKELSRIKSIIGEDISICEPFFGSGIITGKLGKNNSCVMNEKSKEVFSIWKAVVENNNEFFNKIIKYCDDNNRTKEYYYDKREEYNKLYKSDTYNIERTALFYYLINSCHAALIRYGPNGFNTSFKLYLAQGRKYQAEERIKSLIFVSKKLKNINNLDALSLLKNNQQVDVIYCDPPYTKSGVTYESGWSDDQYLELIDILKFQYANNGITSIVSNYKNENFDHLYDDIINFNSNRQAGTLCVAKDDIIGIIGNKPTGLENFF